MEKAGSRFRNGARALHVKCGKRAFFLKAAASLFFKSQPVAKTSGVGFEGRSPGKVCEHRANRTPMSIK